MLVSFSEQRHFDQAGAILDLENRVGSGLAWRVTENALFGIWFPHSNHMFQLSKFCDSTLGMNENNNY